MKYTYIFAFVVGAFAIPQASITSAPAAPVQSGLSAPVSCALACKPGDVNCQAACLGGARPNASQVVETNECARKCDQGDGSASAATAFSNCVQGCIARLFPSSQTAFGAGGAQGSSVAAGASASGASIRPTGTANSVASGSAASGTGASVQSTGAADANSARLASAAGLAGFLAIFAL
ncbi:hypothetical protein CC86DRAFT_314452 [Ophiobolus disseminans]|uniref:Extracellular membrane protein CFEM domain-containing protein n=1 Tax=Ophiobolus disseminans TaxID=1469910 RepID=A0A6A7AEW5_9PLEO|nr:hypothetical protein CC86DRAFT_314452 [Ophiobolus disseminans]